MSYKIPLHAPWIDQDDVNAVTRVLKTGRLTQGYEVEMFEQELQAYLGVKHVVCCSSATAALHLALYATGMVPGDEVVVPAFAFPSVAQVPILAGVKPVFADVEYYSYNISPREAELAITEKTKAIIPVSAFGLPYDMEAIRAVADKHKLLVIGDNAGAIGARYWKTPVGNAICDLYGTDGKPKADKEGHQQRGYAEDISIFSFHGTKTLTTGEGGCLCTNNSEWANRAVIVRDHGSIRRDIPEPKRRFRVVGYNYRMTDIAAALGRVQLQKLDEMVLRRRALATHYTELLTPLNPARGYQSLRAGASSVQVPEKAYVVSCPYENEGYYHAYQRYVVYLEQHDGVSVRNEMRKRGIEVTFGYYDIPDEPFVEEYGIYKRCPRARALHRKTVALPMFHTMTVDQQKIVVETLRDVLQLPQPPAPPPGPEQTPFPTYTP